jgi:hypothetical protein
MTEELKPLWVGNEMYGIPRRAKVVHPEGERLAVVLHEGRLTVLTGLGEIPVPDRSHRDVMLRYFPAEADNLSGWKS